MRNTLLLALTFAALAACQPMTEIDSSVDPSEEAAVNPNTSGLIERTPDLCGLTNYESYIGQPASALQGLRISRPYRVVPQDSIVSQEYNAGRVNFMLDGAGNVASVTCG